MSRSISMEPMDETLERVGDWARERIRAGQEPPWSYYKLMQLLDALEGLRGDNELTLRMASSLKSPELRDDDPQPTGQVLSLDALRPRVGKAQELPRR